MNLWSHTLYLWTYKNPILFYIIEPNLNIWIEDIFFLIITKKMPIQFTFVSKTILYYFCAKNQSLISSLYSWYFFLYIAYIHSEENNLRLFIKVYLWIIVSFLWRAEGYFFLYDCYISDHYRRSKYNYPKMFLPMLVSMPK